MATLPKASELARIQSRTGEDYKLTPLDAEWAIRMGIFEGSDPIPVLWTMAQRWVLFRAQGKGYKTFAAFLRDFSQPINPKWLRTGEFCKPGGAYAGKGPCSEDKLARRAFAQTAPLSQIMLRDQTTVNTVVSWLKGEIPNPVPRATDFAQEPVAEGFLERNPTAEAILRVPANGCPNCNVMIVTDATQRWPADYVWIAAANGNLASASGIQSSKPTVRFAKAFARAVTSFWRA